MELQLHIAVENSMWRIPIIRGQPYNKAIICTAAAAFRYLNEHEISTETPMLPKIGHQPLEHHCKATDCRVFLDSKTQTVHKYYTSKDSMLT